MVYWIPQFKLFFFHFGQKKTWDFIPKIFRNTVNFITLSSQSPEPTLEEDELDVYLESIDLDSETLSQFGKNRSCKLTLKYDIKPATFNFKNNEMNSRQTDGKEQVAIKN